MTKLLELLENTKEVAQNEADFETLEELAFGAGQVIGYLIKITPKNPENATYGVLEHFLPQTGKFGQVQDGIARYIATKVSGSTFQPGEKFETLAAQVMVNDKAEEELTPALKKYILAGCFAENVLEN